MHCGKERDISRGYFKISRRWVPVMHIVFAECRLIVFSFCKLVPRGGKAGIRSWIGTSGSELCSLLPKMQSKGRKRARSFKTIAKERFSNRESTKRGIYFKLQSLLNGKFKAEKAEKKGKE